MATRIRDGVPGKEKALPQKANPAPRRASTNPSPSLSRPIGAKSTSTSSDKNVASSLKATRSRLTVDQPTKPAAAKKPPPAAASDKSSSARLRSSDKSSSVSPSPRTRQAPNPKEKTMRPSSSFSGSRSTGTTLQKGAPSRIVKTAATKSNNVTTKKSGGSAASSIRGSRSPSVISSKSSIRGSRSPSVISSPERVEDPEIVNVPHPQEDDSQSYITDEEVSINALSSHVTNEEVPIDAPSNHDMTANIVEEEEKQTDPPVQAKPDIHEQKDIKIIKSLTSEGSMKLEAKDQNAPGKETSSFHLESQQPQGLIEDNSTDPVNENLEVQAEDQGKQKVKDTAKALEKKEEVKEEDQIVKMEETKEVKNIASPEPEPILEPQSEQEQKPESEPALAPAAAPAPAPAPVPEETQSVEGKRPIVVQGKKDAATVSNDVIEETASKLQEQRKNRVRALAGAFETVISRQEK